MTGSIKDYKVTHDIKAGIVVFLVAVPLCLGISLASGAPLMSGLIAGIIGGIVVGALSGSQIGVSGPAAGLAGVVMGYINELGGNEKGFEIFLLVVILSGIFQLLFAAIKAGFIANYFPNSVIKGLLAAIGITLILKQIPHALGDDKDSEGDMSFVQKDGENTFTEIVNALKDPHWGAVLICVSCLALMLLWQSKALKKNKVIAAIPSSLLVVFLGALMNVFFQNFMPDLGLDAGHMVSIPVFSDFEGFKNILNFPNFSYLSSLNFEGIQTLFFMAFTIAVVGSLETLLSVEATDKIDPLKRVTDTNKELMAQGIGNVIAGFVGGLPLTQVIVRSSANASSGGKTKLAAIIHGVMLIVCVLFIPMVLNQVPLACLAAILFMVGYKLASIQLFKSMFKEHHRQMIPFIVTIVAILLSNLLIGILIGMVISMYFILQDNKNNEPFEVSMKRQEDGSIFALFILDDKVHYLNKNVLLESLHDLPKNAVINVDASRCKYLSSDIVEAMKEFAETAKENKNIKFTLIHKEEYNKVSQDVLDGLQNF